MKILIATGVYPPDIGGPAQYAKNIERIYKAQGHHVVIIKYSFEKKLPFIVRPLSIFFKALWHIRGADAVISFDICTLGYPVGLVAKIFRVPSVVRIGGDFLWESYIERTKQLLPLPHFYQSSAAANLPLKLKIIKKVTEKTLHVFGHRTFLTKQLYEIWKEPYKLAGLSYSIMPNFAGPLKIDPTTSDQTSTSVSNQPKNHIFVWATRPIFLKNGDMLRKAIERVQKKFPDVVLDDKTSSYAELQERIHGAYAVIVPSISDVSPNLVYDGLALGKPFVVTKYTGMPSDFRQCGIEVDPLNISDIVKGIEKLLDPTVYRACAERIPKTWKEYTWDDIAREFLAYCDMPPTKS